jgi:hypothetical protein
MTPFLHARFPNRESLRLTKDEATINLLTGIICAVRSGCVLLTYTIVKIRIRKVLWMCNA